MAANIARQAECRGADISGAGTTRRYIDGKSIRSWRYDGKRTMEFSSKDRRNGGIAAALFTVVGGELTPAFITQIDRLNYVAYVRSGERDLWRAAHEERERER